jgi:hypothetical protein
MRGWYSSRFATDAKNFGRNQSDFEHVYLHSRNFWLRDGRRRHGRERRGIL